MRCQAIASPLAVLVSRQVQLVAVLHQLFQEPDMGPFVGALHVQRLESVVDIDPGAGPGLVLVGLGHLSGVARKVADVADRRFDGVAGTEELRDLLGLGRRFDDNECVSHRERSIQTEKTCRAM